ncbi:hypothetical protein SALCHL_004770 [Streptomyces albus subsp. chlorinus]|nr:hypothetical protein [Streptomyces albus]
MQGPRGMPRELEDISDFHGVFAGTLSPTDSLAPVHRVAQESRS